MEPVFMEIRKQFGFGFMRLPMTGEKVDIPQTMQMVDTFLETASIILILPTAISAARVSWR